MNFLGFAENTIQLVPDGTLFLHIAIILLMVFLLNTTLFKPINRILEEREKATRGRTSEAFEILRRVEEGLTKYELTLRDARAEGYRLMEQERAAAMTERQKQLSAVRAEVARTLEEEKKQLAAQAEEARLVLAKDSRRLAADIGAQILRRELSEATILGVA